jgi:hypothetical protein
MIEIFKGPTSGIETTHTRENYDEKTFVQRMGEPERHKDLPLSGYIYPVWLQRI